MKRTIGLTLGVITALTAAVLAVLLSRPAAPSAEPNLEALPVQEARLLPIQGDNLDGQQLSFPDDFAEPFNLVVMPFNRDQQTAAVGWLETFEQAAREDSRVAYYSIAALTDLSPLVRTLVVQGLNVAVRDAAVRPRVVVAFLEDQAAFVAALGPGDTSAMRVLVVSPDGRVLWQTSGEHTPERAAELLEALAELLAEDSA